LPPMRAISLRRSGERQARPRLRFSIFSMRIPCGRSGLRRPSDEWRPLRGRAGRRWTRDEIEPLSVSRWRLNKAFRKGQIKKINILKQRFGIRPIPSGDAGAPGTAPLAPPHPIGCPPEGATARR
jgi:hypothetical protein